MPASNERIPNKGLAGPELLQIIEKDVHDVLTRDGMFSQNLAFGRVSYEVRVSLHLDNPLYPLHVSEVHSRPASIQQVAANAALEAIEFAPLKEPLTEDETVVSNERQRQIASPNMARVEHDLPMTIAKHNLDTGHIENKVIKYVGDTPDPADVGNVIADKETSEDQRSKWKKPRKARR